MKSLVVYLFFAWSMPWVCGERSCAEQNIVCQLKGIKALLGQKTKYSKAHLKSYAELLSQHGVRVKACSRACVPEDGAACSDEAYTGFLSDYRDLIEPLKNSKEYDALVGDIRSIGVDCINKGCDERSGICDIYQIPASEACTSKAIEKILSRLHDKHVKKGLRKVANHIFAYYDDVDRCRKKRDINCVEAVREKLHVALIENYDDLADKVGMSKAITLDNLVRHAIVDCAVQGPGFHG